MTAIPRVLLLLATLVAFVPAAEAGQSTCLSFGRDDGTSENFCPEARGCVGFSYYNEDRDGDSRGQTWGVVCGEGLVCTYTWDDFDGESSGGCVLTSPPA